MTPERQNLKIAEACGYAVINDPFKASPLPAKYCYTDEAHKKWRTAYPNGMPLGHRLPNYTGDLNAMHEAEKVLTDEQFAIGDDNTYVSCLWDIVERDDPNNPNLRLICATATQRAEAFLRTLNLWEDEDSNN